MLVRGGGGNRLGGRLRCLHRRLRLGLGLGLRGALGALSQPLDGRRESLGHLGAALLRMLVLVRCPGRSPGEQLPRRPGLRSGRGLHIRGGLGLCDHPLEDGPHLAHQHGHLPVALAHALEQALGPFAGRALGVEPQLDRGGSQLELAQPGLQLAFGSLHAGALGRELLLGLGELALQPLEALGEIPGAALALVKAPAHPVRLRPALALDSEQAVLCLDPQLLLGVLALLDSPQLMLSLDRAVALGLEQLGDLPALLLGLAQALLQARHMTLEGLDGRFGGLGAGRERRLAALGGPAGPAFGEQVALATAPCTARVSPGSLVSLSHHVALDATPSTGQRALLAGYSLRRRQAMRDCSDHSSMNPGEAVWLNSPPDCEKDASEAS